MKIGIVTFHNALNYGGVLQAYALNKYLSNIEHDVKTIDFCPKDIYKLIGFRHTYSGIKYPLYIGRNLLMINKRYPKIKKFIEFNKNYIPMTHKMTTIDEVKEYSDKLDIIISGSDQVWNKDVWNRELRNTGLYSLGFETKAKKISYAASIGKDKLDENELKGLLEDIKDYSHISVREESAKEIIGGNTTTVVDPVLLLDAKYWYDFIEETPKEDYIFVYILIETKDIVKKVKELSKKTGLPIKYICGHNIFGRHGKNYASASPKEFVNLIHHAKYVVTNSFHGLAFSVIFEKEFITFLNSTRGTRQVNLLEKVGLTNRIFNKEEDMYNQISKKIDYKKAKEKLAIEIEKSKEFLDSVLGSNK